MTLTDPTQSLFPLCSLRIYAQEQLSSVIFALCSITKLIIDTLQLTVNVISHESDYHIEYNFLDL
jgi:hypothetical protein